MPIFMMFGKYSREALKGISPERTDKAVELIEKNSGKVISMYAVMGEHDLVFTLEFPTSENAIAASVALNKLTGISFKTSPVVEVEKFDRLITNGNPAQSGRLLFKIYLARQPLSCYPSTG